MSMSYIKTSKTIQNVLLNSLGLSMELAFVKVAQRKRLESSFILTFPHSLAASKKTSASIKENTD